MTGTPLPGDEWPEAPRQAQYKDGRQSWWQGEGHGWVVATAPPLPWPEGDLTTRSLYGPPGTVWLFDQADVVARGSGLPGGGVEAIINRLLRKLGVFIGLGDSLYWRTPERARDDSGGRGMRWYNVTIIGQLGQYESVAHTFKFRTSPTADATQTVGDAQTLANKVRDQWVIALASGEANQPLKGFLSPDLVFKEVRVAYLEQTAPATFTTVPGKTGPRKVFHYPRPTYLIPTQYATFTTNNAGLGTGGNMPYEVAVAATFHTGQRGGANRGRLFLGPFTKGSFDAFGNVAGQLVASIPTALGANFITPLKTGAGVEAVVLSKTYCGNLPITGISCGNIADSQRRRRRSLPEARPLPRLTAL